MNQRIQKINSSLKNWMTKEIRWMTTVGSDLL